MGEVREEMREEAREEMGMREEVREEMGMREEGKKRQKESWDRHRHAAIPTRQYSQVVHQCKPLPRTG